MYSTCIFCSAGLGANESIEERWEAVERGEKLFRDSRMRVQSENIGLARMRDGTRLIRVGEALDRELAAWREAEEIAAIADVLPDDPPARETTP